LEHVAGIPVGARLDIFAPSSNLRCTSCPPVRRSLNDSRFVRDLDTLIDECPEGYAIDDAAHVAQNIITKLS
jgi:hypothetical protein